MRKEETIANSSYAELKTLKKEYSNEKRALSRVKSNARQRELKEHIDGLKIELGWTLLDHGKFEQGLVLFGSLSWRDYGEVKCNGMVRALTEMGYYDEARDLLKAGLKRFPKSYALWVAMGAICDSLGDTFGLLECIETALQFAPEDNSAGLYNKALALIKLGCYGDALPIIEELIERYPGDPKYLVERGALALDMGYPQEAVQFYQKAMEIWQQSQDVYAGLCIYTGLCSAYIELGMKREAMEILKKGIEKFPKDEELKKFLKDIEDDMDDSDGGEKPPILGMILLMALIRKKLKNFRK